MKKQDEDLSVYLRAMVRMKSPMKLTAIGKYKSLEEFLLTHRRAWSSAPLPKPIKPHGLGRCFEVATKLADIDRRFIYCEGIASIGYFPIEHAWCVDRSTKRVVDPAWATLKERAVYWGVCIHLEFVREILLTTKTWSGAICVPQMRHPILTTPVKQWKHPINYSV